MSAPRRPLSSMARSLAAVLAVSAGVVVGVGLVGCDRTELPRGPLSFQDAADLGKPVTTVVLSPAELLQVAPPETVTTNDPYYVKIKRFRGLPLAPLLERAFPQADLATSTFVLRAADGYAVPIEGSRLLEPGAFLAIADLDAPAWEPIGPAKVSPAPFYLVWQGQDRANLTTHPRPWQLKQIERVRFETAFPHTAPGETASDAPSWRGFRTFRAQCLSCHAINREGGRVGPELNVPQSIVEYRPEAQIRAYIRNPRTFRYGNMPPHPDLRDEDLDALVGYLSAMKSRKFDPDARAPGSH